MKYLITFIAVLALSISNLSAQDAQTTVFNLLTDELGSFKAVGEAETKPPEGGLIGLSRAYEFGDKKLSVTIGFPAGDDELNKAAFTKSLQELEGMIELAFTLGAGTGVKKLEGENQNGYIGFDENAKSAGLMSMINNSYIVIIGIQNENDLKAVQSIYKKIYSTLSSIE